MTTLRHKGYRILRRAPVLLVLLLPVLALAADPSSLPPVPAEAALYGLGGASLIQLILSLLVGSRQVEAGSAVTNLGKQVTDLTKELSTTREELARTYVTRADFSSREQSTATKAEALALAAQAARLEAEAHSQRERLAETSARLAVLEERIGHVSKVVDEMDASVALIREQNNQILNLLKGDGHARR